MAMDGKLALVFCLVIVIAFVDSFPSTEDDYVLTSESNKLSTSLQKIKDGLNRISQLVKELPGNDTETPAHTDWCLNQDFGLDVTSRSISVTKVIGERLVTVNETTWSNSEGEEVALYRVTVRKPVDASVSREELDIENTVGLSAKKVPAKLETVPSK